MSTNVSSPQDSSVADYTVRQAEQEDRIACAIVISPPQPAAVRGRRTSLCFRSVIPQYGRETR